LRFCLTIDLDVNLNVEVLENMDKDLIERAKTLIDMDMRSGEGGNISPEYIARSLQVSV